MEWKRHPWPLLNAWQWYTLKKRYWRNDYRVTPIWMKSLGIFLIWFSRLHFQSSDVVTKLHRPPWSWLYGSWIYNCLCTQCLLPLTLRWQIPLRRGVLHTTLCDEVCQSLAAGRWFSPGTPVSSINKTYRHNNEYNWNIVESGIKHHIPNPKSKMATLSSYW